MAGQPVDGLGRLAGQLHVFHAQKSAAGGRGRRRGHLVRHHRDWLLAGPQLHAHPADLRQPHPHPVRSNRRIFIGRECVFFFETSSDSFLVTVKATDLFGPSMASTSSFHPNGGCTAWSMGET